MPWPEAHDKQVWGGVFRSKRREGSNGLLGKPVSRKGPFPVGIPVPVVSEINQANHWHFLISIIQVRYSSGSEK